MSRYALLLDEEHLEPDFRSGSKKSSDSDSTRPNAALSKTMSSMFDSLKQSANTAATSASSSMRGSMNKAASVVGLQTTTSQDSAESSSSSVLDEVSEFCPTLSFQQRVMGFGICFGLGYIVTFLSFRLFVKLVEGNPAPFVFLYTFGNIMSLMSSMFLCGPQKQFKNMFDDKRRITSVVYLTTLGTSIVICFIPFATGPKVALLVSLLLVQMCASLWYTLSYIPYGRATAKRFLRSAFAADGE